MNFYRFTLGSIIWHCPDPDKPEIIEQPDLFSTIIRMGTCGFFIFLVSKPFELWILHSNVLNQLLKSKAMVSDEKLYEDFAIMHQQYPFTWIITLLVLILFLWPIYFRSCSKKFGNIEYELAHNSMFIEIIKLNYSDFVFRYNDVFRKQGINASYQTNLANPPIDKTPKQNIVNTKGEVIRESTNFELYGFLDKEPIK